MYESIAIVSHADYTVIRLLVNITHSRVCFHLLYWEIAMTVIELN